MRILAIFLGLALGVSAQTQKPLRIQKTTVPHAFKLEWDSTVGRTYFVQQAAGLNNTWTYFPEVMAGEGGVDWMGVATSANKRFFRLIWTNQTTNDPTTADHDGDGIPSYAELTVTNTDPLKYSSAGNGVSDRGQFPNPANGIYVDSLNGLQYSLIPNPPGVTGPKRIAVMHYFEAPDYQIQMKKVEKAFEKEGYSEFTGTSSKRYLKWDRYLQATDVNGNSINGNWQFGESQGTSWPLTRFVMADYNSNYTNSINPLTGAQTITGAGFGNTNSFNTTMVSQMLATRPWGGQDPAFRWMWVPGSYTNNRNFYWDLPPYSVSWDDFGFLYYGEELYNENTMAMVATMARANPPSYPANWAVGNPWAMWDLWPSDLGLTYSRFKFRIRNVNGMTTGEPAKAFVYFDSKSGAPREEVMTVQWNGQGQFSPEYTVDPGTLKPNVEGVFHVGVGSAFFELDLGQADERKAGEQVTIPLEEEDGEEEVGVFSPMDVNEPTPDIRFPGMDDSWYEGATITLTQTSPSISGAVSFKARDPLSGYEVSVPLGQNLAADFFSSRGFFSGFQWKIAGVRTGLVTLLLTYSKGPTTMTVQRTAMVVGDKELLTDLNNDGSITPADAAARDAALATGATTDIKDAGTEFLFFNDVLSNGIWEKDDVDPAKPAGINYDDDAERISIKPGITEGQAWLEGPHLAALSFYMSRECKPADKIVLQATQKFNISPANPFPAEIYVRADEAITFPPADPQALGTLVLKVRAVDAGADVVVAQLPITIVQKLGATKYFHASRDYMFENNSRLCIKREAVGNPANPSYKRIVSMIYEKTSMATVDSYHRAVRLHGIEAVATEFPTYDMVVNGNFCYSSNNWGGRPDRGAMTDRCHGYLVTNSGVQPGSSVGGNSPFESAIADYIGFKPAVGLEIKTGIVPVAPPVYTEALGGFGSNLPGYGWHPWYGLANAGSKKVFFIAMPYTVDGNGAGGGASLKSLLAASGCPALPGGVAGEIQCIAGDGGSSLGLCYKIAGGAYLTKTKGLKHFAPAAGAMLRNRGDYFINTYLLFKSSNPR